MLLFIFESIGTSELLLVGIVALIFLGPRKMPQMARKLGKIMAEFRGTANEFKETWSREANFEEEAKLLDISSIENETVTRTEPAKPIAEPAAPAIKDVDAAALDELKRRAKRSTDTPISAEPTGATPATDKQNWL